MRLLVSRLNSCYDCTMPERYVETDVRVEQALGGDKTALAELFQHHRSRLRRMVQLRMHPTVQGRCDPSDVLQEAFVDATEQLQNYAKDSDLPFFLWLRLVTGQRLAKFHRRHLGVAKRDAKREISISPDHTPEASAFNLASLLAGSITSPSGHLIRDELRSRIQAVLDAMEPNDREVLALRHFEELTIRESAMALGISETAASSRYRRAILRVKAALAEVPGLVQSDDGSRSIDRIDQEWSGRNVDE